MRKKGSPSNVTGTGKKGNSRPSGFSDAASDVGKAVGSSSFGKGRMLHPTGAGSSKNNMVAANAALKRYPK